MYWRHPDPYSRIIKGEAVKPANTEDDSMSHDVPTTAEIVANLFDDDGSCFTNDAGQDLFDHCRDLAIQSVVDDVDNGNVRFVFGDGSSIVALGDGWDIGFDAAEVDANEEKRFAWPGEKKRLARPEAHDGDATAKIGCTYRHKDFPAVSVRVTDIKPNGAVWGKSGYADFATDGATFAKMYEIDGVSGSEV